MKYMVTFALTKDGYKERVQRFLETGAPPPEGVNVLGRWFTVAHNRGFILAESNDPTALFRYCAMWNDLIDFEVHPVIEDGDVAAVLKSL